MSNSCAELKCDSDPTGCALPSWLTFTPPANVNQDFEFSGVYPILEYSTFDFLLSAEDSKGQVTTVELQIHAAISCHSNCLTCDGANIDDCISCRSGRYLFISICKIHCPDGYYADDLANTCNGNLTVLMYSL